MPLAYSYIRFSSAKQALGDSLRRQHAKAVKYAHDHGLTLDESTTYRDMGVSAYDSSNVRQGALGVFLQALRAGSIPQGSYLLVEQLDRLSRANIYEAQDVLREIVKAGVSIVTLVDGRVLDKSNLNDLGNVMISVALMFRAHEESERKAGMLRDAWTSRREARPAVLTRECPLWLRAREDRSGYDVIEDRVASIQKVFQLSVAGFGNIAIVRRANSEGWAAPGKVKSWHATLVTRLLNNRALLGEHHHYLKQGKKRVPVDTGPWLNYYPVVIDEALFNAARSAKALRADMPRRRDKRYLNIFQGVIKCACGSSLSRKYKGGTAQPNYVQYLCTDRIRNVTKCKSISAIKLVEPVLRGIYEASFVSVAHDEFTDWSRLEVVAAQNALDEERVRLSKLTSVLEAADDLTALIPRYRELQTSVREKEAHLVERREWLASLSLTVDVFALEGDLQTALASLAGDEHIDYRAALHARIARVVESITVNTDTMTAVILWRNKQSDTVIELET